MKLNAIVMVKNEEDIVVETIRNALTFCDNIYVFDNGSDDGTWEKVFALTLEDERVVIAEQSGEIYRNQLRNRVFNKYNHLFSRNDWWYILDADEMLDKSPKPLLERAAKSGCDHMSVWQAQFYFTDKDLEVYDSENMQLPVSERRRYYRINWQEQRFFINDPNFVWSEHISGRIPPYCKKHSRLSPVCRHYPERTPYQIINRRSIRKDNPYSFFHVKNKSEQDWIKKSEDLHYYTPGEQLKLTVSDRLSYQYRLCGYWVKHRFNNLLTLAKKFQCVNPKKKFL